MEKFLILINKPQLVAVFEWWWTEWTRDLFIVMRVSFDLIKASLVTWLKFNITPFCVSLPSKYIPHCWTLTRRVLARNRNQNSRSCSHCNSDKVFNYHKSTFIFSWNWIFHFHHRIPYIRGHLWYFFTWTEFSVLLGLHKIYCNFSSFGFKFLWHFFQIHMVNFCTI